MIFKTVASVFALSGNEKSTSWQHACVNGFLLRNLISFICSAEGRQPSYSCTLHFVGFIQFFMQTVNFTVARWRTGIQARANRRKSKFYARGHNHRLTRHSTWKRSNQVEAENFDTEAKARDLCLHGWDQTERNKSDLKLQRVCVSFLCAWPLCVASRLTDSDAVKQNSVTMRVTITTDTRVAHLIQVFLQVFVHKGSTEA